MIFVLTILIVSLACNSIAASAERFDMLCERLKKKDSTALNLIVQDYRDFLNNTFDENLKKSQIFSLEYAMKNGFLSTASHIAQTYRLVGDSKKSFKIYKALADLGDAQSQGIIGVMYKNGEGTKQDYNEAIKWLSKASENNDSFSMSILGEMYIMGDGVKKDYSSAYKLLIKAAEHGESRANSALGVMFYSRYGVDKDCNKAISYLEKTDTLFDFSSQALLSNLYIDYENCKRFDIIKSIIALNHSYAVPDFFKKGKGDINQKMEKNYDNIVIFLRGGDKTAENLCAIGLIYIEGPSKYRNYIDAFKFFQESAKLENPEAMYRLGWMYYTGNGAPEDKKVAFEYLERAANLEHPLAAYRLGIFYYEDNKNILFKWIMKAALNGNPNAQEKLWVMYYKGEGTEKNYEEALKWFSESVKNGNSLAKKSLDQLKNTGKLE